MTRLAEDGPSARLGSAPLEARIVAYADKRAGQRLEPMAARFASWRTRYPSGPGVHVQVSPATTAAGRATMPPSGAGWGDDVASLVEARSLAL